MHGRRTRQTPEGTSRPRPADPSDRGVLVWGDQEAVVTSLVAALGRAGVTADGATGEHPGALVDAIRPDVVILELSRSALDPAPICRSIRSVSDAWLLVVTPPGATAAGIGSLDAGADDFMVAPYAPIELAARVRSMRRRQRFGHPRAGT